MGRVSSSKYRALEASLATERADLQGQIAALQGAGSYEVLFVDDGSTDGTAGAVRAGAIEVAGSGCWADMENTVNESGGGDTSPNDAFGHAPRSWRITGAKKRALAGPFCYAGLRWTGFFLRGDSGEARSTPGH